MRIDNRNREQNKFIQDNNKNFIDNKDNSLNNLSYFSQINEFENENTGTSIFKSNLNESQNQNKINLIKNVHSQVNLIKNQFLKDHKKTENELTSIKLNENNSSQIIRYDDISTKTCINKSKFINKF